MRFDVVSLFPEIFSLGLAGVVERAIEKEYLQVNITNPRDHTKDVHQTVDDRPYGGGDGMLLMAEPISKTLDNLLVDSFSSPNPKSTLKSKPKVIYLSPQGKRLDAKKSKELSKEESLVLICGRYGGLEQRVINKYVDEEISIGDYVLSGGELAALVLIDSVARFVPGVIGNPESPINDSFENNLLEGPQFTRPEKVLGQKVPEVLLSGNHEKIAKLRKALSLVVTYFKRPDLLSLNELKEGVTIDVTTELLSAKTLLLSLSEEELYSCGIDKQRLQNISLI